MDSMPPGAARDTCQAGLANFRAMLAAGKVGPNPRPRSTNDPGPDGAGTTPEVKIPGPDGEMSGTGEVGAGAERIELGSTTNDKPGEQSLVGAPDAPAPPGSTPPSEQLASVLIHEGLRTAQEFVRASDGRPRDLCEAFVLHSNDYQCYKAQADFLDAWKAQVDAMPPGPLREQLRPYVGGLAQAFRSHADAIRAKILPYLPLCATP